MPRKTLGRVSTKTTIDTSEVLKTIQQLGARAQLPGLDRALKTSGPVFESRLRETIAKELEVEGKKLVGTLKDRTKYAFQSTPSYLWESNQPGRKQYPKGTVSTFSFKHSPLGGTFWGERTQQYIVGQHFVHNDLTYAIRSHKGSVELLVGYPRLSNYRTKILFWILFGTVRMQPRPFLTTVFDRAVKAKVFDRAVNRALKGTVVGP